MTIPEYKRKDKTSFSKSTDPELRMLAPKVSIGCVHLLSNLEYDSYTFAVTSCSNVVSLL